MDDPIRTPLNLSVDVLTSGPTHLVEALDPNLDSSLLLISDFTFPVDLTDSKQKSVFVSRYFSCEIYCTMI